MRVRESSKRTVVSACRLPDGSLEAPVGGAVNPHWRRGWPVVGWRMRIGLHLSSLIGTLAVSDFKRRVAGAWSKQVLFKFGEELSLVRRNVEFMDEVPEPTFQRPLGSQSKPDLHV